MSEWLEVAPNLRVTRFGVAWIPSESAIVVADVHIGYARAARRRGGWLPAIESPEKIAERVRAAAQHAQASRVIIAGDLRHSTRDVDDAERADVQSVLDRLRSTLTVDVIAGNHDRGSEYSQAMMVGSINVVHEPPVEPPETWTVCGHLHPTTNVRDETGAGSRFPCVLVGPRIVILPTFTEWAGGVRASRIRAQLPPGEWKELALSTTAIGIVRTVTIEPSPSLGA